jgi:hypothetical protein
MTAKVIFYKMFLPKNYVSLYYDWMGNSKIMLYEDTTMWTCVATPNLQSCIMASIIMHQKD